jgi:predicted  nucleic acid-binding Zn-ribbon protein
VIDEKRLGALLDRLGELESASEQWRAWIVESAERRERADAELTEARREIETLKAALRERDERIAAMKNGSGIPPEERDKLKERITELIERVDYHLSGS